MSNETTAEALRASQPIRLQRTLLSDRNPWMRPVADLAELVRSQRAPAAPDNFFVQWERLMADGMEKWLDLYRDYRDFWVEASFRTIYESPLVESLAGLHEAGLKSAHKPHAALREGFIAMKKALIEERMSKGRFIDALARILMYQQVGSHFVAEERGFRLLQSLRHELPDADRPSLDEVKSAFKDAAMMMTIDPERAIASVREVLPDVQDRQRVVDDGLAHGGSPRQFRARTRGTPATCRGGSRCRVGGASVDVDVLARRNAPSTKPTDTRGDIHELGH